MKTMLVILELVGVVGEIGNSRSSGKTVENTAASRDGTHDKKIDNISRIDCKGHVCSVPDS